MSNNIDAVAQLAEVPFQTGVAPIEAGCAPAPSPPQLLWCFGA
jgi:hypothetical protein